MRGGQPGACCRLRFVFLSIRNGRTETRAVSCEAKASLCVSDATYCVRKQCSSAHQCSAGAMDGVQRGRMRKANGFGAGLV